MLHRFSTLFFIAFLCIIMFFSCQKEKMLSCDPLINEWSQINLINYESADRSVIVALPFYRQKAIYVGLSGTSKVELWRDKYEIVKKSGEMSDQELFEYRKMIYCLKPVNFDTERGKLELSQLTQVWVEQMMKDFQWTEQKVFDYVECWMTKEELLKSFVFESVNTRSFFGDSTLAGDSTLVYPDDTCLVECECRHDVYCSKKGYDECYSDENDYRCKEVEGCGFWGNASCTGICVNGPII